MSTTRYMAQRMKMMALMILTSMLFFNCEKKAKEETKPISSLLVGASSSSINPEVGMFIAGDKPNRRFT